MKTILLCADYRNELGDVTYLQSLIQHKAGRDVVLVRSGATRRELWDGEQSADVVVVWGANPPRHAGVAIGYAHAHGVPVVAGANHGQRNPLSSFADFPARTVQETVQQVELALSGEAAPTCAAEGRA